MNPSTPTNPGRNKQEPKRQGPFALSLSSGSLPIRDATPPCARHWPNLSFLRNLASEKAITLQPQGEGVTPILPRPDGTSRPN